MEKNTRQWKTRTMLAAFLLVFLPTLSSAAREISPGQPAAGHNVIILPYIALGGDGDGWHFITGLALRNLHGSAESVTVEIFDNEWKPLPVLVNGETEMSGEQIWTVPAKDMSVYVLTHPSDSLI